MAIAIILMIAFWYLPLPLALQILMTVFGSLHCLVSIVRLIKKIVDNRGESNFEREKRDLLDKYLPKH